MELLFFALSCAWIAREINRKNIRDGENDRDYRVTWYFLSFPPNISWFYKYSALSINADVFLYSGCRLEFRILIFISYKCSWQSEAYRSVVSIASTLHFIGKFAYCEGQSWPSNFRTAKRVKGKWRDGNRSGTARGDGRGDLRLANCDFFFFFFCEWLLCGLWFVARRLATCNVICRHFAKGSSILWDCDLRLETSEFGIAGWDLRLATWLLAPDLRLENWALWPAIHGSRLPTFDLRIAILPTTCHLRLQMATFTVWLSISATNPERRGERVERTE